MNCEECELELSGGEVSAEVRAHVASCAQCAETSRVLGAAALAPVSDEELLLLRGISASAQAQFRRSQTRGGTFRKVASLALAAGLGALLASAAVWQLKPVPEARPYVLSELYPLEVAVLDGYENNQLDDDVFAEVGWPSPTEGDL